MAKIDIYQAVTDRILKSLDKGTVPWRHPIKRSGNGDGWPKSLSSGKGYRGINIFLLAMTSWAKGYDCDYWLTYKQAKAQGGQVRKGEKSSLVIFWKRYAIGRLGVCDHRIGQILAHAPKEDEETWPCEAVCNAIDKVESEDLEHGVHIAVLNMRGVHFRARGGDQERKLAKKYETYRDKIGNRWPCNPPSKLTHSKETMKAGSPGGR
jgi:hypothetical protein